MSETDEVRIEVVRALVACIEDAEERVREAVHDAVQEHQPSERELALMAQVIRERQRQASDRTDPSVLDVTYQTLWALARVQRIAAGWWLPPGSGVRTPPTLGALLKIVPVEVAHEIVGVLVWAGLMPPPE